MALCIKKPARPQSGGFLCFMSKKESKNKQNFLLSFFEDNGYEEKMVNDFYLVKNWNGNTKTWQVGIYTKDSFKLYKEFTEKPFDWIKNTE